MVWIPYSRVWHAVSLLLSLLQLLAKKGKEPIACSETVLGKKQIEMPTNLAAVRERAAWENVEDPRTGQL